MCSRSTVRMTSLLIEGDMTRLVQVLVNLIRNGFDEIAEQDDPQLWVEAEGVDGGVDVRIRDTGPGIPPEVLPHLFEPFFRGPERANRTGLGLGLFIVSEIAKSHGGIVDGSSTDDGDTRFSLTLPRVAREPDGLPC